jgi:hypothetical protein
VRYRRATEKSHVDHIDQTHDRVRIAVNLAIDLPLMCWSGDAQ